MSHTISVIDGASRISSPHLPSYPERESWSIWDGLFLANQASYVRGVLVATTKGAVQAQNLTVGDVVVTPLGSRTVTWSGQSSWGLAEQAAPIRVRPEAIALRLPATDILVAPWHCLWVENRLVPATLLINGLTVVRTPVEVVVYCNVLFDRPTHGQLAIGSDRVAPIWSRLVSRAKRLGYVRASGNQRPNRGVRLVINGVSVGPIEISGDGWTFFLPPGHKVVQLASPGNAAVLRIETITQDTHEVIPADHPNLTQGWGHCERDAEVMWRRVLDVAKLPISHIVDSGIVVVFLKT